MSQELQQLQQENKQIKDLLVNEVSARQQIGGRLEQMTQSAKAMQVQFASILQEVRELARKGDTENIIKKVNFTIGEAPTEQQAQAQATTNEMANT